MNLHSIFCKINAINSKMGHSISCDTAEIIRTCLRWHEKRVLEAWEINVHGERAINRDDGVRPTTGIYKFKTQEQLTLALDIQLCLNLHFILFTSPSQQKRREILTCF